MTKEDQSIDSVSCKLLIYENDSIWLVNYTNAKRFGLPGGRVQLGESLHEALAREADEELGVSITSYQLVDANITYQDSGRDGQDCLELYFVAKIDGKPRKDLSVDFEMPTLVSLKEIDEVTLAQRYKDAVQKNREKNV